MERGGLNNSLPADWWQSLEQSKDFARSYQIVNVNKSKWLKAAVCSFWHDCYNLFLQVLFFLHLLASSLTAATLLILSWSQEQDESALNFHPICLPDKKLLQRAHWIMYIRQAAAAAPSIIVILPDDHHDHHPFRHLTNERTNNKAHILLWACI